MSSYEYKVVPAPTKGVKAKGVRTPEARYSLGLEELLNEMGGEGWEFQRAETLPSVERSGLTGSQTVWRHVLVFRRRVSAKALPQDNAPLPRRKVQMVPEDPPPARLSKSPEPAASDDAADPSLKLSALIAGRKHPD